MAKTAAHRPLGALLSEAQRALGLSQAELGERMGSSRNTVARWQAGRSRPLASTVATLAGDIFRDDPALAAELAASVGETLESLGLARPQSQEPPILLADAILCAAAEAGASPPNAVRPMLVAALERAEALGLTVKEVLAGLRAKR